MAFIVKGEDGPTTYRSALANAGPDAWSAFQRQRDCYILAKAGSRDMRRLWNDYANEVPAMARLVVADVEKERAEGAKVSEAIDVRLREAERLVTKQWKPPKPQKPVKVSKAAKPAKVAKSYKAELESRLSSPDPDERENARDLLRRLM